VSIRIAGSCAQSRTVALDLFGGEALGSMVLFQPFNYSTVQLFNGFNCRTVQLLNGSIVQRFNCSAVQLFNGSIVQRFNCSTVQLFNGSTAQRFNCSTSFARRVFGLSAAASPPDVRRGYAAPEA
jgi:hypothetical protein